MSDNPFLLPPGGAKPESRPPGATEPVAERDADAGASATPSHYIAVPASVESATHRIARPAAESAPSERAAAPVVQEAATVDAVAEDTRVAPPRQWALVLPDGTRLGLNGPTLLGRDPAGIPESPAARLLPVADSGKTVSKTHALLEPAPEGVRVRELHSTNGVAIDTAAGRQLLTAGGEGIAPAGSTILLGSFALVVAVG